MATVPRTVRVVRDEHGVHLDPHSPAMVGAERLSVPGGVIRVDPGNPWVPPSLTVLDVDSVLPLVNDLWGGAAAGAVADEEDDQEVLSLTGPGLAEISTLALLRWLRRWRPVPLDTGLLTLELAAASYRCRDLVDVELTELLELQDYLRMVSQLSADQPLSEQIAALLHECLSEVEQDRPEAATAVQVAQRRLQHVVAATPALATPISGLDWLQTLAPQRALAADVDRELRLAGVSSVDWFRVRGARVGREEDGVHWSIDESVSGTQLCVVVSAAKPAPSHPVSFGEQWRETPEDLRFRLLLAGWPLPAAEGELRQSSAAEPWAGAVLLTPAVAAAALERGPRQVSVDVASGGQRTRPISGDQALVRAVARSAGRATIGRRILGGGIPLAGEAREGVAAGVVANCRAALVLLDELESSQHPEAVSLATEWMEQVEGWLEEGRDGTEREHQVTLTISEQWALRGRSEVGQ